MNKEFWEGKKVLITGHTGFKGAWLSLWLQYCGAEVSGIARAPAEQSLYGLASVADNINSQYVDIRDGDRLKQVFQELVEIFRQPNVTLWLRKHLACSQVFSFFL